MLKSRENHTGYPEGDYVVARYECIRGIVALKVLSLIGPAESRKGPESRGKPRVKNVLVLSYRTAALRALGYILF